ncbi:MAG TPA: ATP-binding cassette domain-containing protein, partial [Actinomycetota bacterium]|nr:ATP-binding cassette domain-containing protein [Actinomycetota bacterium]
MTPVVELRGIVKRFPGVVANDGADLALGRGEVHALLGENGAGKTTLMSVLSGIYRPDAGTVMIDGQSVTFRTPRNALEAGIGMVHQHFHLVQPFTVAENVLLGVEGRFRVARQSTDQRVAQLAETYGLKVDPSARI